MAGLLARKNFLHNHREPQRWSTEPKRTAVPALFQPGRILVPARCQARAPASSASVLSPTAPRSLPNLQKRKRLQSTWHGTERPDVSVAASSFTIPEAGLALLISKIWQVPHSGLPLEAHVVDIWPRQQCFQQQEQSCQCLCNLPGDDLLCDDAGAVSAPLHHNACHDALCAAS